MSEKNPPVVEVVLGVQFQTLPRMTSAHYGVFWDRYLTLSEWPESKDEGPLPEQFESFDSRPLWGPAHLAFKLSAAEPPRIQLRSVDCERIIQVQPNRFIYNWQKRAGKYPSYDKVREGFEKHYKTFEQLVTDQKLGPLLLNQWEVTYVDRVQAGPLWQKASDWHRVIPGLLSPPPAGLRMTSEGANGEWHYELPAKQGRVHVAIGHGSPESRGGEPPLMIRTSVRGPIGEAGIGDWNAGFELGHRAANDIFDAVISDEAKRTWGLKP